MIRPSVISYFRNTDRSLNMKRLVVIIKHGHTNIITDLYMRGYPFRRLKHNTRLLPRRASKFFQLLIEYGDLNCYDINTRGFYSEK